MSKMYWCVVHDDDKPFASRGGNLFMYEEESQAQGIASWLFSEPRVVRVRIEIEEEQTDEK